MSRVLVTGSSGRIGRSVVRELRKAHIVRGFDMRANPELQDQVVADIADREAVRNACAGIEVVVHLAAYPEVGDFYTQLLGPNIIGLVNVFESARENKVARIITASSGQVLFGYPESAMWTADLTPKPRNMYGATKTFAEAVSEVYAYTHGISVIVVRLGWVPRDKAHWEELNAAPRGPQLYLSPGDAGRFFRCAVEAGDIRHVIVNATSKPRDYPIFDIESARRLLGFEPQDTWPEGSDLSL
jgi:uronate dehydrogenase